MRYLRLTWLTVKNSFKSASSYKASFVFNMFSQLLDYAASFSIIFIVVSAFGNINGWNQFEVMLLYGISLASYALAGFFFYNFSIPLPDMIKSGAFDEYLVKPIKVFPFLLSTKFNSGYMSHLTLSIILITTCFINLGTPIGPLQILLLIMIIISGGLIFSSFFLFSTIPAFFVNKTDGLFTAMFFFRDMINYPISIFPHFLRIILVFILPYGFINFFPAQMIIDKQDYLFFGSAVRYASPVVGVCLFAIAVWFFNFGAKHYKSSGS